MKPLSLSSFLIATLALSLGIPSRGLAQSGAIQPAPGAGEKFRFAIVADPQVSARNNPGKVSINAQETAGQAADELNAMQPRPAFVLWAGDLVNVFEPNSVANFKRLAGLFAMPNILMNGNHDTLPPYDGYRELQKEISGVESPYYSFDVGKWHFIITPCNLQGNSKAEISAEAAMLAWMEADLEANKSKPTAFFNHLHFMPQGLTQTEWYNQPLELRKKILDLLTRHGNVKYYFNGHVHNGIKTAEKVAWEYKGIKFFTVPTIIQPRPYGEEYPKFQKGIERGGYYLLVDADGDKLTLRGRLAGVPGEHVFPSTVFKPFKDEEYPLWFRRLVDLPAQKEFQNGDFQAGFEHWSLPERYVRDGSPFFIAKTDDKGAQFAVETPVESIWSSDEYHQASQIVEIAPGKSPTISGRYFLPSAPKAGGGYIMAVLIGDSGLKGLMMFRWSNMESDSDYLPRSIGYQVTGHQASWLYLQELGKKKRGMFWKLPDSAKVWHPFIFNLGKLYDQTHAEGAFAKLGVTKMQFAVGVWNQNNLPGMRSEARFGKLALNYDGGESLLDNAPLPMGDDVFTCEFGQKVADQEIKNRASAIRPKKGRPPVYSGSAEESAVAKGYRFEPDSKLPNVLLLGDSISIGYTLPTRAALNGVANVFRPMKADGTPKNCGSSAWWVQGNLDRWIDVQPKWDLIHFNVGLHDLNRIDPAKGSKSDDPNIPNATALKEYKDNLEQIAIKLKSTGARVIFATTTPTVHNSRPVMLPEDVVAYNAAAVEVMKKHQIDIDDVHAEVLPRQSEMQIPANCHFQNEGNLFLAQQVANSIKKKLPVK